MEMTRKTIIKATVLLLIVFSLFTLMQAYYSAYVHMALLLICIISCRKEQHTTLGFFAMGAAVCIVFVLLTVIKNIGSPMEPVGFYLHYITWPIVFICVDGEYTAKEKKRLLYFIILICIVGNILSLIQLEINPEISRELAGTQLEDEKIEYYKKGIGGYGYVFAMAFFTYGIVRWLKVSKNIPEKIYLTVFLVINSLFILYASYTTAIVISIALIGLSLISKVSKKYQTQIIICALALLIILGNPIMEFCYDTAEKLELEWVATRFEQLLDAQNSDDMTSLRRVELYKKSWDTFIEDPLFGGVETGGHSQFFDSFAQYGIFAGLMIWFFLKCKKICEQIPSRFDMSKFYIVFFVFACIDTCDAMQLPVIVFFVVPLISSLEMVGKQN